MRHMTNEEIDNMTNEEIKAMEEECISWERLEIGEYWAVQKWAFSNEGYSEDEVEEQLDSLFE